MSENKKRRVEKTSDPSILMNWLEELSDGGGTSSNEESDGEVDDVSHSDHNSDSEQEISDSEDGARNQDIPNPRYYLGKDSLTKWNKERPKTNVRTRSHNIVTHLHGPKGRARETNLEVDIFDLFIDASIMRIITNSTNIYIREIQNNFSRERDARLTDEIEIRALIGLLYLIGSLRCSRKNASRLWDNSRGNGLESCYLTMSEKRFRFLLRCLRFDDIRDRQLRKEIDKLAPIRDVFEMVVHNFQKYFSSSEYLTVDEQLLAFRGNCPFRQFIPSKPAKYGLKTFALVDAKTAYTLNLETYVGIQPEGPYRQSNAAKDVVMRLVQPVEGSNRNITADNWFTSIALTESLKEKGLTYVGILRKNKKEIPPEFLPNKERLALSSIFGFTESKKLVSYCPKKNKAVLVISTMHHDDAIDTDTGDLKKPEIITFYNMTKVGVDLVDQLCQNNDVSRNTRRWPMVVFYNLLNIAAINSLCIYKANHENVNGNGIKRTTFLENLAWELIKPQILRRAKIPQIPAELRRRAHLLLGIEEPPITYEQRNGNRGRCYQCGRSRDKTTRRWCQKCQKWTCGEHLKDVCVDCFAV